MIDLVKTIVRVLFGFNRISSIQSALVLHFGAKSELYSRPERQVKRETVLSFYS